MIHIITLYIKDIKIKMDYVRIKYELYRWGIFIFTAMSTVYYSCNFKGFGARVKLIRLYSNFVYIMFVHIGTFLESSIVNNNKKKNLFKEVPP
jgi:hypothetical protein